MKNLVKIKKALISVSDKTNLEKIVSVLLKYKIKIISSGGTYKKIKKLNYDCTEISEYTGFHEILNGRVKTLHPKIHAGILSVRDNKKHKKDLLKNNYDEIDLVIVNFYPFEQILKKKNNSDFIIENIDIGGPTMVRAAAKNFKDVVTITNPNNYQNFIDEVNKYKGSTSIKFRENSASYAFNEIAYYDSLISNYFNNKTKNLFPHKKTLSGVLSENLRYGENPHQNASLYKLGNENSIKQLHGKRLSFNNYNDIFSALNVLKQFKKKIATVIVKHSNPCGISINKNNFKSYESALNCDPRSAFGGVIACNYIIKKKLAKRINKNFFEVIIGNGFDLDALNILKKKKNTRIINSINYKEKNSLNFIFHNKSFLLQESDDLILNNKNLKIVSKKKPTKKQLKDLIFAFNVCKNIKSNAIVLVKNETTIGIGSGQPSRLDSCEIAVNKAKKFLPDNLKGSVAASDAFFPFTDGVEKLVQAGVDAIIQPSGSIRDKEIINFANETNTVLVFSNTRHFKH